MAGTPIRSLSRLLDQTAAVVWVVNTAGQISYLSAGVGDWLGINPAELLDRQAIAGAPVSSQWQDQLAATLSAPPGLNQQGTASLRITPPKSSAPSTDTSPLSLGVRFVRVGTGDNTFTLAVAGEFDDRQPEPDIIDVISLRQQLDHWRRTSASFHSILTSGESSSAVRLRQRVRVASMSRMDVLLVGPSGCGGRELAHSIHQATAPDESIIEIDGPLMDGELLEASLGASVALLESSSTANTTAMVGGFDQMPADAQDWLANLHHRFEGRLRLIAVANTDQPLEPHNHHQTANADVAASVVATNVRPSGLITRWVDTFCAMTIPIPSLKKRVEDLTLLATAVLDHHRARLATGKRSRDSHRIPERFERTALDALVIYPWPGEFRELEQTIHTGVENASSDVIAVDDLPLAVRSYRAGDPIARAKVVSIDLDQAVRDFEAKLILEAVEAAGGNRAEAARRLGISRSRLLRKLEETKQSHE